MSKSQKQTTKQESDPWAPAQSHLKGILGEAQSAYDRGKDAEFYPFSTATPFSNQTLQALQRMEGKANAGSPTLDAANRAVLGQLSGANDNPAMGYLDKSARGDFLNSNPFLDATFNTAANQVQNRINSQFSGAGRYGSGAHQGVLQQGLGDLATQIYGGNYAQERGNQLQAQMGLGSFFNQGQDQQLQAAGMAPGMFDASIAPDRLMGQVGGAYEQQYGNVLKDLMARYDFGQNNQWNQLGKYMSLVQPIAGLGGKSTAVTSTPVDYTGQIIGLGMQAASMFSDENMKTDIEPANDGAVLDALVSMPSYTYRYKNGAADSGAEPRIGPMAQDWASKFGGDGKTIPMPQTLGALFSALRALNSKVEAMRA